MSDRRKEFRVGIVVLGTAAASAVLLAYITGASLNLGSSPATIQIRLDRAPGVGPNTPVRKDGVLIGRVVSTSFLPEGGVLVTANLAPGAPIYTSDVCRVRPSSLFGDAVINFAYDGAAGSPVTVEPGAMVQGAALPDPIEALTSLQLDVAPTITSIGEAADAFEELTERLNRALGEDFGGDQVNGLLEQATIAMEQFTRTMDEMSQTMNNIDAMISDPRLQEALDVTSTEAPRLLTEMRVTAEKASEMIDSFGAVVTSAETNLSNLEGFTTPLGERGEELSSLMISSIENLDRTLAEVSAFTSSMTDAEGSLSKLLNDPTFYENVNTVVGNANVVIMRMDELLRRMRPIVEDVRVFTDKIAREPGRIVGGALNKGPGLK